MTQQFPLSGSDIFEALAADSVFTALLGEYNFKGGGGAQTALSVVSPWQDMPAIRGVSGVECIIQDVGTTTAQSYLTDAPDLVTAFSVFCVAWEPASGADLQNVTNYLVTRFVGAQSVETVAVSDGLGALVQAKVLIKSNMPIRPVA
eukprot:GHVR01052919.1.p2 GENE.GHVR01052919.1~~GHVR01052919.1.p2  ORF type:complete len:147 (+),score=11.87 GHVR01052919.1:1434-1874(+)